MYQYALWHTSRKLDRKISVTQCQDLPRWASLNTATVEVEFNRFVGCFDINCWSFSDKPINKAKLYKLFRALSSQILKNMDGDKASLAVVIPHDFFLKNGA